MSTTSSARPGLRAHVDSTRLSFQDLVTRVTAIIGRKLTAYIAGSGCADRRSLGEGV